MYLPKHVENIDVYIHKYSSNMQIVQSFVYLIIIIRDTVIRYLFSGLFKNKIVIIYR